MREKWRRIGPVNYNISSRPLLVKKAVLAKDKNYWQKFKKTIATVSKQMATGSYLKNKDLTK